MPKKITMNLSVSSIQNAIKEIRQYQNDLNRKCEEFCRRLTELGKITAQARVDESPLGKYVTVTTNISSEKMGCKGILLAKGAVKEQEGYAPFSILLAIEFGSGIHYNPTPNPLSAEMGYGVGTFPGQVHAFDQNGWYFWSEEKQQWIHSYGVKATMPMYSADMEIIQNIVKVAKQVFR